MSLEIFCCLVLSMYIVSVLRVVRPSRFSQQSPAAPEPTTPYYNAKVDIFRILPNFFCGNTYFSVFHYTFSPLAGSEKLELTHYTILSLRPERAAPPSPGQANAEERHPGYVGFSYTTALKGQKPYNKADLL